MSDLADRNAIPGWVVEQMPAGYQTRMVEIQRLTAELREMDRFSQLLWQVGDALTDAVGDLFVTLKFDVESLRGAGAGPLAVKLENRRRLLLHVSRATGSIQKKDEDLAQIFQLLHEFAGGDDRVVLVANSAPERRPADRPDPIASDAIDLLQRLGANFVSGPSLFSLWTISFQEPKRARTIVDRLHAQDGGVFLLPSA